MRSGISSNRRGNGRSARSETLATAARLGLSWRRGRMGRRNWEENMKNRISLSGVPNDVRHLGPVHRLLTVFVGACATVLLLAAGSPPLQAQDYTPLEGLRVSDGRVQFLFASAGQCIVLSNSSINGVVYTTHTSKWQRRTGSTWGGHPRNRTRRVVLLLSNESRRIPISRRDFH